MSATENKRLIKHVFDGLAEGDFDPLIDAMAADFRWRWMGTVNWSQTFEGKEAVVDELLAGVRETLAEPLGLVADRFIADGDHVVVEGRGRNTTTDGRPYNNRYCWVCRVVDGELREIREYMDTELVTETFGTGPEATGAGPEPE